MKKELKLPKFKSEDEERYFWENIDIGDYYDENDFESVSFPNLKPTSRPISIRIPEYILIRVKEKANEIDIPYQALIKQYISNGVFERKQK